MISLRALGALACLAVAACSTSNAGGSGSGDDAGIDAPIGPLVCGLPVASSCPATAPCTFTPPACAAACQGYYVTTDGTWTYYYSASGGELAGEVPDEDAGIEACPYGFMAPSGCKPTVAGACVEADAASDDAGVDADATTANDGASEAGGDAASEAGDAGGEAGAGDGGALDGAGD
jgi:hypothetical protein